MQSRVLTLLGFLLLLIFGVGIGYGAQFFLTGNRRASVETDYSAVQSSEPQFQNSQEAPLESDSSMPEVTAFSANPDAVNWTALQSPFFSSDLCFIDVYDICIPIYLQWEDSFFTLENTRRDTAAHSWYKWLYGKIAARTNSGLYQFYLPYSQVVRPAGHPDQLTETHKYIFNNALSNDLNPAWVYTIVDAVYTAGLANGERFGETRRISEFPVSSFAQRYQLYRQAGTQANAERVLPENMTQNPEFAALALALSEFVSPGIVEAVLADEGYLESQYLAVAGNSLTQVDLTFQSTVLNQADYYTAERQGANQWILCRDDAPYICSEENPGQAVCQNVPLVQGLCNVYFLNL